MKTLLVFVIFYTMNLSAQDKLELYFDFNKEVLNEKSNVNFTNWLKKSKDIEVIKIQGFCDSVDSNLYNKKLSSRRANAVLLLLKQNNVRINENLKVGEFGEDFVQSKIQSENRKVEIYFKKIAIPEIKLEIPESLKIEEKINNSKVGDNIKIENLNFYNISDRLLPESESAMSDLVVVMQKNKKLIIEIQGHICCQTEEGKYDVSTARAKKVYDILVQNGIKKERLAYKGFGSSRPIFPLPENTEDERKMNRRVEILILKK